MFHAILRKCIAIDALRLQNKYSYKIFKFLLKTIGKVWKEVLRKKNFLNLFVRIEVKFSQINSALFSFAPPEGNSKPKSLIILFKPKVKTDEMS